MNDPIPAEVYTLWWWTLALAWLVLLPIAAYWLHSLWRASNSIRVYAQECADAAEAIERNCRAIPALDATIEVAGGLLDAAGSVAGRLDTAAGALEARASR